LCGEIVLADIGVSDKVLFNLVIKTFENKPEFWAWHLPLPIIDTHKYQRGLVGVFSGGPSATGAARLSALAAARSGAGAVTVLSPGDALQVNASHLTSIMLRKTDTITELAEFVDERRPSAFVLGPGFGVGGKARDFALAILAAGQRDARTPGVQGLVLDADGITSFRDEPATLFDAIRRPGAPAVVLTPHEGEFGRLFPDIASDGSMSKLEKARAAAARSNAVIVYKGADTVIAAANGLAAINSNGAPWLATAGSGDVLSGIVAGLLAQRMSPVMAACAAVWLHAEAGRRFGPGLIAEDLPLAMVPVLREVIEALQKAAME